MPTTPPGVPSQIERTGTGNYIVYLNAMSVRRCGLVTSRDHGLGATMEIALSYNQLGNRLRAIGSEEIEHDMLGSRPRRRSSGGPTIRRRR